MRVRALDDGQEAYLSIVIPGCKENLCDLYRLPRARAAAN